MTKIEPTLLFRPSRSGDRGFLYRRWNTMLLKCGWLDWAEWANYCYLVMALHALRLPNWRLVDSQMPPQIVQA